MDFRDEWSEKFFETAATIMAVLDTDGTICRINDRGCETLGCEREELLGSDWFEKVVPETSDFDIDDLFAQLTTDDGDGIDIHENTIVTKSGETRTIKWHNSLLHDESGSVVGLLGSGSDITERKENERQLRHYKQTVEGSTDMLNATDTNYTYYFANRAYREFHDIPPDKDLSLLTPWKVHGEAWPEEIKPRVDRALDGETVAYEMTRTNSKGEDRILDIRYYPLEDEDGAIVGNAAGMRDITPRKKREQNLEEERNRVNALFENSQDAIAYCEFEGNEPIIREVNSAFEETFGYEAEYAIGESIDDLIVPKSNREEASDINRHVRSGKRFENEVRRKTPDGLCEFIVRSIPLEPGDDVEKIYAIYQDITERKEYERNLERFKKAIESSTDMLTAVDRDFTYIFGNEKYREFHGLSNVDLSSLNASSVLGEDLFETVKPQLETVLQGEAVEYEQTRINQWGEERILDIHYYPLKGTSDTVRGVVAAMRDITENRRRQRELREQKLQYESLFNSIRDAILVADTDRRIINCNWAFTDLFGYDLEEIEGKRTEVVFETRDEFERMGELIDTAPEENQFPETFEYRKKSGQVFPGETNVSYLQDADDDTVGFIGLIRDISDREDRIRQLQVIDRVLRHNLHNDMNIIQGYAKTIQEKGEDEITTFAEHIERASEKLLETVDKEREITQFLSQSPQPETIDMTSTVRTVVEATRHRHPNPNISQSVPQHCEARATSKIGQAIEEVLENAIEHSDQSTPEIDVHLENDDDIVELRIADNGPGIPEMEQQVLTGGAEIEPLYHGSGLGLWLVNLIVRQSDGLLKFGENDPRGSILTIRLPAT